ncbi:MAG: Rab family GTPase [Promethearchaeota archaeon]
MRVETSLFIVGDGFVGKTTLLKRYVEGLFYDVPRVTIGVDFYLKRLFYKNYEVAFQLWDFGGQKQFRFMQNKYIRGDSGALLLFDLSESKSINTAEEWINSVRSEDKNLPIILVGTKYDLVEPDAINDNASIDLMFKNKLLANIKTSSKTGLNINYAFILMMKKLLVLKTMN